MPAAQLPSIVRGRTFTALVVAALAGGALLFGATPPANATTTVTLYVSKSGTATSGCASSAHACGTIGDAVTAAEADTGDDVTIDVSASSTAYDELVVIDDTTNPSLTIAGAGASSTTLSGSGDGCDITITDGVVTVSGLTVTDGSSSNGGGVCNGDAVTLTNDVLSDDDGYNGGGVDNNGDATFTDDTFTKDTATEYGGGVYTAEGDQLISTGSTFTHDSAYQGGGVFNGGSSGVEGGTLSDDSATDGGAVANYNGTLLESATLSNDTATGDGGGLYNEYYHMTVTDDTFSSDSATDDGGGIYAIAGVTVTGSTFTMDKAEFGGGFSNSGTIVTLNNDTWFDDSATTSGGAFYNGGTSTLADDTLSGNTAPSGAGIEEAGTFTISTSILNKDGCTIEAGATVTDAGYNVESDKSCNLGSHSKTGSSSIGLATALAANGSKGPETLAIGTASSAFEEVPTTSCTITTDERGDPRPGIAGKDCDAGAFELQPSAPSAPRNVKATAGKESITVSWSPPSSDGGTNLSSYEVYCSTKKTVTDSGKASATASGTAKSAKVSKLKSGTTYYCVVVATNSKGTSPVSSRVSAKPKA